MNASEFKAKCLRILDTLEPDGLLITKHGRPVAKLLPVRAEGIEQFIGSMRGKIVVSGDIFSTGVAWNAESGHSHRRRPARR